MIDRGRPRVAGLLLAAGAGRRMGRPKALVRHDDGTPWVTRSVQTLRTGGCAPVTVVVGAQADAVRALLDGPGGPTGSRHPAGVRRNVTPVPPSFGRRGHHATRPELQVVEAADWREGMGASLRQGLRSLTGRAAAAVVLLVDLPDVGPETVRRLLALAAAGDPSAILARAAYDGEPGHPVLIGAAHWAGVIAAATGDVGARGYLADHDVALVECGDVATGADVDTPGPPPGSP